MSDVRPPDAVSPAEHGPDGRRRNPVPQSFQTRLTFAFLAVVGLTLVLVAPVVVLRLDDYFRQQEEQRLHARSEATAALLQRFIDDTVGDKAVVVKDQGTGAPVLNPEVKKLLGAGGVLQLAANTVAEADVEVAFGPAHPELDGLLVPQPIAALTFHANTTVPPAPGQARDPAIAPASAVRARTTAVADWGMQVSLSNPYTSRASTLAAINALLLVMASAAFLVAILVAAFLAHRFTTPITRLTEASRRVADGDLGSRVATDDLSSGTLELRALSTQFNLMAARLEESVGIIRGDRDRSRDFLADVSHELRTPIAAMRTFIELLQGPAGLDAAARAEFLDSSAAQLDRLDWLAQNLLELSKLDSGLVLLDLRPDDIRGTIESAVEQQQATAERKGIGLSMALPERPLRIRHDSPRIGQVVTNLVGNALKFTSRGGDVRVLARAEPDGGARIEVLDTGAGISPAELPLIFDRFYRGAQMNEVRSTGSGLGLAIVKSIVDMHHGTIAVESRVGRGSRFVVTLPRDPREVTDVEPSQPDPPGSDAAATPAARELTSPAGPPPDSNGTNVHDSSPAATPAVNHDQADSSMIPNQMGLPPSDERERSAPPT
jgi:signal transduction histidine kinase